MNRKNFVAKSNENVKRLFNEMRRPLAAGIDAIGHDAVEIPQDYPVCSKDKFPF